MPEETKIDCSKYKKQEARIKSITDKINMAKDVKMKAKDAEELLKEVEILLTCMEYDRGLADCKNCRFIANLRKKTAELIIKAKRLA